MEHLLTIRKNLQQAQHFPTEQAVDAADQEPIKAAWLQKRTFLDRNNSNKGDRTPSGTPVSSHKELINWARLEVELLAEEYHLPWVDLGRLRDILTFKSLVEYLVQLSRGLAVRITNQ